MSPPSAPRKKDIEETRWLNDEKTFKNFSGSLLGVSEVLGMDGTGGGYGGHLFSTSNLYLSRT